MRNPIIFLPFSGKTLILTLALLLANPINSQSQPTTAPESIPITQSGFSEEQREIIKEMIRTEIQQAIRSEIKQEVNQAVSQDTIEEELEEILDQKILEDDLLNQRINSRMNALTLQLEWFDIVLAIETIIFALIVPVGFVLAWMFRRTIANVFLKEVEIDEFKTRIGEITQQASDTMDRMILDFESEVSLRDAKTFFESERYDDALEACNRAYDLNPNFLETLTLKGSALINLGRSDEALDVLNEAVELDNNSVEALTTKGGALVQLGDYRAAIATFNDALKLDNNCLEAWFMKGQSLGERRKYNEALAAFEQVRKLAPDRPDVYYLKALMYAHLNQDDQVRAELSQAIQRDDQYRDVANNEPILSRFRGSGPLST